LFPADYVFCFQSERRSFKENLPYDSVFVNM
jgi:hypothetical protein